MINTNSNTTAIDINPFVKIASHMTRLGFYAVSQDHYVKFRTIYVNMRTVT